MNDSLKKLLTYIEPKILNIQDKRVEILSLGDSYKTLKEIVDLGQNSYRDILEFYDQDFIIRCIKISNDNYINNLELYKSSKYLLRKNDSNLLELPQYKQNYNLLNANDDKYVNVYLSGIGHMHLCDFQLTSPFLSMVFSGMDSSNSAKKNLEMVNEVVIEYLQKQGIM